MSLVQTSAFLPEACNRTRQHVSLRLDRQLSELEVAVMENHLARCSDCRTFANDLESVTEALRDAELVEPPIRFELPAKPARFGVSRAGATAAAGILVAVALGGVMGLGPDAPTARSFNEQAVQQRLSVAEHLSLVREGATATAPLPPQGVEAAEQMMVTRSRGAATTPATSFGEIPPEQLPGDSG